MSDVKQLSNAKLEALGARIIKKARDVEVGDTIAGYFKVGHVSHGPLDGQIRFRNGDETYTVFFDHAEDLAIEVQS